SVRSWRGGHYGIHDFLPLPLSCFSHASLECIYRTRLGSSYDLFVLKESTVQNGQLRTHRQLRGWSQDDLVRELVDLGIELGERQLGVSASLISRWEHGVTQPRPPYPKPLCQLFHATGHEVGPMSTPSPEVPGRAPGGPNP